MGAPPQSGPVTVPIRRVSKEKALAVSVPKTGPVTAPLPKCRSPESGAPSFPRLRRSNASEDLDGEAAVAVSSELVDTPEHGAYIARHLLQPPMPMSPPPTPTGPIRTWPFFCIQCGVKVEVPRAVVPMEEQLCDLCAAAIQDMEMADIIETLRIEPPLDAEVEEELSDAMSNLSVGEGRRRRRPRASARKPRYQNASSSSSYPHVSPPPAEAAVANAVAFCSVGSGGCDAKSPAAEADVAIATS